MIPYCNFCKFLFHRKYIRMKNYFYSKERRLSIKNSHSLWSFSIILIVGLTVNLIRSTHIYCLLFACTLCMYVCELRAFFVIIGRQFPNWIPTHVLIKTNWQISDPKFLKLIRFQFPLTTYLVSFHFDAELVWDKLCWAIIRKPRNLGHKRQMETEVLSHACRQWADFNLVSSQILINLAFINIYGNIFV